MVIGDSASPVRLTAEKKSPKDSVWDRVVTLSHFDDKVREVPVLQKLEHDHRNNRFPRAAPYFIIGPTPAPSRNCRLDGRVLLLIKQLAICLRELEDMLGPGVNLCVPPSVSITRRGV